MALQTPQFVTSFTTKIQHSFSPTHTIRFKNPSEPTGIIFAASDRKKNKKKLDRQRERDNLIKRRNRVENPGSVSEQEQAVQQSSNENGSIKPRERDSTIIRRNPVEKPVFASTQEQPVELSANENAFVYAWLGFASVILVEGIALAASGFFPEEVDKFLVKYLYPSYTPTVFLFFAGAVAYGVVKYKQNENLTEGK
ncbi:protein LOW PSII ACCUMULATION 2, chloroplastic [Trifolium repens]|nr:protein LOW PSII ACCUMULATION 2, chloroplastic [Trifolium repens]